MTNDIPLHGTWLDVETFTNNVRAIVPPAINVYLIDCLDYYNEWLKPNEAAKRIIDMNNF